jgi:hypothetical protein
MATTGYKLRLFYIHGSGAPRIKPASVDWTKQDIGVGLRRGLRGKTWNSIELTGTY